VPTITDNTKVLTDLLYHLVSFPTITNKTETSRVAIDWIEEQLRGLPLHIRRLEHNGFPSLVATTRDTKNPRLWLAGHIDVVSAPPESFKPVVKNGRLYGRGTHDMKFAIAAFITLLQELGEDLPSYDLGLMITSDEEVGGFDGVKWLLNDLGYRGQAVIIPDSNGSWSMEMGAKGIMWCELTATGKAAHAGRAWEGDNAIDRIIGFTTYLKTHFASEPCGDPGHKHSTFNLATITGGTSTNQVPASATATLDIRTAPEISQDTVVGWLRDAELKFPSVKAKVLIADPAYTVKPNVAVELFEKLTQQVTGHDIRHFISHGTSDARFFARYDIPTINVTPIGSGYHVDEEWIDLEDLGRFYDILNRFTETWTTSD
jgi:succinyl-diaminopimelate desuccinylase